MNITILGVGNAGSTVAADLTLKGHKVVLLKTSDKLHNEHYNYLTKHKKITIEELGEEKTANIFEVTTDYSKALTRETELIIIYVQTNFHEDIIKKIAPFIHDNQMIMFEPGYLSTAYLLKYIDKNIVSIEAESSPIDCRITRPGHCTVLFKNVRNPVGIYPSNKADDTLKKLESLKYNFTKLDSVIEAALHNPNLIVHTVGAIMSVPRIEYSKGEYWMYKEVFTPKVWNLVEKLDEEKMSVLEAMGLKKVRYVDACKFRNFMDDDIDATSAFFDYAYNHSPKGPSVPDSRYITEDVSQGLCLLESLGKFLNVETKITTSLIDISSALLNYNFREDGRNLKKLESKYLNTVIKDTMQSVF